MSNEQHSPAELQPQLEPRPSSHSLQRSIILGIVGLVAAGLSSFAIGTMGEVFKLPAEIVQLGVGGVPGGETQKIIVAARIAVFYRNSALWLGTTGAIVGGLFGLVLGYNNKRAMIVRMAGSATVGAASGAAAGVHAVYYGEKCLELLKTGPLSVPESMVMQLHATTWLILGLGIGLGTALAAERQGFALNKIAQGMIIGGIAAAVGGILYPFVAGIAIPLIDPSIPIPLEWHNRLLWMSFPCSTLGLALGRRG